ncbi:hypothetical protein C8N26_0877 [Tenacibaculum lutimaris]|uniref:PepSY-like beta-lactamase-inhibitor n=1 Tax=Tenacibaculum lutimaris TaxID=285258 RepID=A0A420E252_9FLAO|nr:hypothetical protein [Tenacibaculum lutimaris]RKF04214.1 hypothetical protein C8N26_0877 [Tenacibaculum lutimaris]
MKTQVIGLIMLGLTNLMFAQQNFFAVNDVSSNLNKKKATVESNSSFVNAVENSDQSLQIKMLRKKMLEFNIEDLNVYSKNDPSNYDVVLKEGKNKIAVTYNQQGDILNCNEYFYDVRLPLSLQKEIVKKYPGWSFASTKYHMAYEKNKKAKTKYKILLKKDEKTKTIVIKE